MKLEIVYPKRAFIEQHGPQPISPNELCRESVSLDRLVQWRKNDLHPIVLLITANGEQQDFDAIHQLLVMLNNIEDAICPLSHHIYIIINGLLKDTQRTDAESNLTWQKQAEVLYALGVDEVYPLPLSDTLIAGRLRTLSSRMLERVQQQQAMARYEEAQKLGSIGSWHHDFNTNQSWWSRQVYQIFGYAGNHVTPDITEFMAAIHPDDQKEFETTINETFKNRTPFQYECRIIRGDGIIRTLYCWGKPILNERGVVTEVSGVIQDITERRQAENDLRHHEEILSYISEYAPASLFQIRLDTDDNLYVDYYSLGSMENFGRRMPVTGERLEPFVRLIYSHAAYDEILAGYLESARTLTRWAREFRVKDDFGEIRWIAGHATPARLNDGSTVWRGVLNDITEQKHLEEQLQMADRLSSIGTLAAGIAHEINNPLSFVMSNLEYTLDETKRPADLREDGEIELALLAGLDGARRISVIVQGLMTYARHNDAIDEVVDLNEVLQTTLRMTHSQFNYHTEVRLEMDTKESVIGNEGQLCQVFVNLILNALHAMPAERKQGNIVTIRLFKLRTERMICVEVEDNGVGIEPKIQKRLFDPFYSTRAIGQGTGLGLYVCRNMITAMGGRLELESVPGQGSTFRVLLKCADVLDKHQGIKTA